MSNLIKAAEELEYVPKEDLIRMAQSGDSRFPPYLVLSEIQRRTQNEKAYSAMQPPPTTTVAEEKVAEFAQSGLGGMVSPPFSPPEDLSMSPPMQMAANGGLTGYSNKGKTETTGSKIKEFLTAPLRGIEELGRLRYNAGKNISNQLRENASYRADIKTDLRTRSLPVITGEKTLEEFKNEMRELYNDDFIKDDKGYRNLIKNYYYNFEQKFLPRFQKEIAETGEMPKDVIKYYDDYENFRNSKQYLDRFYKPYERPDLNLSEKMQEKQEGGLTGYANQGRTTYQDTFSYSPSIAGNVPISQQGLIKLLEERGITSEEEQEKIANILSSDLARFSQPRNIQIADVLRKSEDFIAQPYKGIDSPFANVADRRGFAGEILEGVSPGPKMPEGYTPPVVESNQNGDNNNPFEIQNDSGEPTLTTTATTTPTTDVFGTLDELRKRMKDVEYKSPTADDLRSDRTSETLMYLGSLIAGSTDRKEFGQGLADLTSKVVASKRADDKFLNQAKLAERGLLSADLQLATALENLKVKAVQANNTAAKNKIDEALGMIQAANLADQDTRKRLLEKATQIFLGLSGESTASQVDLDAIVDGAKS